METWLKQSIFGAVSAVAITVGLVWYEKRQGAAAVAAGGAGGTAAPQTLSLSGANGNSTAFTLGVPSGGSFVSSTSSNPAVAVAQGSTITGKGVGTASITVAWTLNGAQQQTVVPVTVTA